MRILFILIVFYKNNEMSFWFSNYWGKCLYASLGVLSELCG